VSIWCLKLHLCASAWSCPCPRSSFTILAGDMAEFERKERTEQKRERETVREMREIKD